VNPLERYLDDIKGLGVVNLGADVPGLEGLGLGYQLGADASTSGREFFSQALQRTWSSLPPDLRRDIVDAVVGEVSKVTGSISGLTTLAATLAGSLGAVLGTVVPVIDAIVDAPMVVAKIIAGVIEENDQRRRDARLRMFEEFATLHPRRWVHLNRTFWPYTREIWGKKDYQGCPVYPPSGGLPFDPSLATEAFASDCVVSSADFCGLQSCRWTWYTSVLFAPLFHPDMFGKSINLFRGMERSNDGGAAVLATILGLQAALLSNPVLNLMADGRDVSRMARSVFEIFWKSYREWSSELAALAPDRWSGPRERAVYRDLGYGKIEGARIDGSFKLKNLGPQFGDHLYVAPSGLIGAYLDDTSGSTTASVLSEWRVRMSEIGTPYSSTGGNEISCADYNSIIATWQAFFATRRATLGAPHFLRGIAEQAPELLVGRSWPSVSGGGGIEGGHPIYEPRVRAAIEEGGAPPSRASTRPLILSAQPVGALDQTPSPGTLAPRLPWKGSITWEVR